MTHTRKLQGAVAVDYKTWHWREYEIMRRWFIGGSRWSVWHNDDPILLVEDGRAMVRALLERESAK